MNTTEISAIANAMCRIICRSACLLICFLFALETHGEPRLIGDFRWDYRTIGDEIEIKNVYTRDYSRPTGTIKVPDSINGKPVTYISGLDSMNEGLSRVEIFSPVKCIGRKVFYGCSGLTEVIFWDDYQLVRIGDSAFCGCVSLPSITIPNGVLNIEESTFYGCCNLTNIVIGSSVTNIGDNAFYGCSKLTTILIPEDVAKLGKDAFKNCSELASVTFLGTVPSGLIDSCVLSYANTIRYPKRYSDIYEQYVPSTVFGGYAPMSLERFVNSDGCVIMQDGNVPWIGDFDISHDNEGSLRNGEIANSTATWIETTINGKGRLSFWWKSSSEEYDGDVYDYAYLSIDGVPNGALNNYRLEGIAIGGQTDWTNIVLEVVVDGPHTIRWTYCKDDWDDPTSNIGEDCVWLDEFSFTPKPTISFDIGASANGNAPDSIHEFAEAHITLPNQTGFDWADHVFSGWTDGISQYAAGTNYTVPSSNVTLCAIWIAKSFISFNIGDGTGETPQTIKALPDEIISLPTGEGLTLTDYAFGGWADGAVDFAAGGNYIVPSSNVVLSAKWIAKRFLTFTLDGGEGEIPITIKDIPNAKVTLPNGDGLHKAKHTFIGWNDGTQTYEAGAEYVVTDTSIEFTAVWTANTLDAPVITSADVANGGTIETESSTIEIAAEDGTAIYYTMDGKEPTTNSALYAAPFTADGMSVTIKAFAVKDDCFDSAVAEFSFTRKPYSEAECLNADGKTVSTGGVDAKWERVLGGSAHDGVAALRSGTIGDGETSTVEMTVEGAGQIAFWWKVSSERETVRPQRYDYVSFLIDDAEQKWLGGEKNWTNEVFAVSGEGAHTLKWMYQKNENGLTQGEDCAWLDEVAWTPWREITTKQTAVPIPYGWLEAHGLLNDTDAETAAKRQTGKRDGSGRFLTVEDDYIAGTDPTNENDLFSVSISISNGVPVVTWKPDLNTNGANRVYTIYGKESLSDVEWITPTNALCRFFKVGVAMPTANENHDSTGDGNGGEDGNGSGGNDSGDGNGEGGSGNTGSIIPSGYSTNDIQCVSCTGSEWYDLGLPPTLTMKTQIKCSFAGQNEHVAIIGVLPASDNDVNDYRLFIASSPYEWFLDFPGSSRIHGSSATIGEVREVEFGNFYIKDLETDAMLVSGSTVTAPCPTDNIRLFRTNYAYLGRYTTGSVYYVRIYDLNVSNEYELVRNLVPCKSDANEVGLFDLVEKKFYKSNGTNVAFED